MSDLIIYGRCSRFSEPCGLWIDLSDLIYRIDAAPPSLPIFRPLMCLTLLFRVDVAKSAKLCYFDRVYLTLLFRADAARHLHA